ncbi:hypothetical protein [Afifella pfennigii]|uniref:hypothetical protein n=1 Tax=Afifella pfennigii TaxID=209897 RepID=UPI00047A779C|nr:hypothetical protein [Afifella pfennigii]
MKHSLTAQIEEVEFEIRQRGGVYTRLVASRRMRQSVADLHMARMQAVLATLRWLQTNEGEVRAFVASRKGSEA